MSQKSYIFLENIVSCNIKLSFKEELINIKDFFQSINIDSFKYINEVKLKGFNEEDFLITLRAEDLKVNDKESRFVGPVFIIELKNDKFEFIGPPLLRDKKYLEVLDKMNTDGNFILMNFCKFYSDKINFNLTSRIFIEIEDPELLEKIYNFYDNLNTKCDGINILNAKIEGIRINLEENELSCSMFISKMRKEREDLDRVAIIMNLDENIEMKLCDLEIKKYLNKILSIFNQKITTIIG